MAAIKKISEENQLFSGIIIAASFSIIVFLLSLIVERTLTLDIGLFFLLFSIIFQYETIKFTFTVRFMIDQGKFLIRNIEDEKRFEKRMEIFLRKTKVLRVIVYLGQSTFFIGLMYLFSYFELIFLIALTMVYIIFDALRGISSSYKLHEREKKEYGIFFIMIYGAIHLIVISIVLLTLYLLLTNCLN